MSVRSKKYLNYNPKFLESKIIYHSKFTPLRWSNFEMIIQKPIYYDYDKSRLLWSSVSV